MGMKRWNTVRVDAMAVAAATVLGAWACSAQEFKAPSLETLKPMLKIQWRLGPDYPMGIQDCAVGSVGGKIVSAGGFTRHPLDVCKQYPNAFGGDPSGFTKLSFAFDPSNESAGWKRISDRPGSASQGGAVAVVDDMLYSIGGINYTDPFTYRETYRLQKKNSQWIWKELPSCRIPWPLYGASAGAVVIGKKIYLIGGGRLLQGPWGRRQRLSFGGRTRRQPGRSGDARLGHHQPRSGMEASGGLPWSTQV